MPRISLAGAVSALALAASPAHADDVDAAAVETITVTGIAASEAEIAGRPGGADLVRAADFENRAAVSLRDALAFSPGVYAQPRFGQEVRLSIRGSGLSRGFHMRGLTLLQDGVPINLADDNGDFQELHPTLFTHLEVFRGASALRFGGSTLGGAINAVTPTGRSDPGLAVRVDGGSFDTLRSQIAFGGARGAGDAWIALAADRSDGDRQHARRDSLRLNANAGIAISDAVSTRFYASAMSIDQELPGPLRLADVRDNPRRGNFVGDQQRDIDSIRLQNRTSITLPGAAIELAAFANVKDLFHPIFQVIDQKSTDTGLIARAAFDLGPVALTIGSNARFGRTAAQQFVNRNGRRGARTFAATQRAETIDVYGEGRWQLGEVELIAGGVYTYARRRIDQRLPTASEGRVSFDEISPRLGFVWAVDDGLRVYGNYSRSHEFPGFVELNQANALTPAAPNRFVPLSAQRAWTAELGVRGAVGPARIDVSVYRATLRGELLQFNTGPLTGIPAATFNADRTLHQGVEAGLDLAIAPWLQLRQVYTWSDFRFRNDAQYGDNRLPVVPEHFYRAELRIGTDRFHVAPNFEWVPRGAFADYANTLRVDGYRLIGATAEAELRPGVALFLDVRNVTSADRVGDIAAVVDFRRLAPFQQAIFYPVERRAVFGGLRARY
jgi:iron complex outermembrane receptor protein